MLQGAALERVFTFNGIRLADPDPKIDVAQVHSHYAGQHPALTTATVVGPEQKGTKLHYEFRQAVGTKG